MLNVRRFSLSSATHVRGGLESAVGCFILVHWLDMAIKVSIIEDDDWIRENLTNQIGSTDGFTQRRRPRWTCETFRPLSQRSRVERAEWNGRRRSAAFLKDEQASFNVRSWTRSCIGRHRLQAVDDRSQGAIRDEIFRRVLP